MDTQRKVAKLFLLLALVLFSVNLISAADISQSWDCSNSLGGCVTFKACSDRDRDHCDNCGLARPVYAYDPGSNFKFSNYYFNAPQAGSYDCTLSVTETGYAYYDGAQTSENVDVYLAGSYLGRSTDWRCNSGTSCKSCTDGTTTFTQTLTLAASNNEIKLEAFNSHALRSVAISCNYNGSTCTQTNNGVETCDNLDNDCDGSIDEGLTQTLNQEGVCSSNSQTCSAGVWVNNTNNVLPSNEICDNIDNDCDGDIDDGLLNCGTCTVNCNTTCAPTQTQVCSTGLLGICSAGIRTCSQTGLWGSCVQTNFGTNEVCNNLDDNCNGQVDEGLSNCNTCTSNCGGSCVNGNTTNLITSNSCSGNYFITNNSWQLCSNNLWLLQTNSSAQFCGSSFVIDQVCSGNALIQNWSQPTCTYNGCGRENTSTWTVCPNGCANNQCIPSVCVDTQAPTITINTVPNMLNWSYSSFNWSWAIVDNGCSGLNHFNVSFFDSNGTNLFQGNNFTNYNLIVSNLIINHSYYLSISAIDNQGNFANVNSLLLVVNSTSGDDDDNDDENDNNDDCDDCSGDCHLPFQDSDLILNDSIFVDESPVISLGGDESFVINDSKKNFFEGNFWILAAIFFIGILILLILILNLLGGSKN